MRRKLFLISCAVFVLLVQLTNYSSCIKEYSYERPPLDTLSLQDSVPDDTTVNTFVFSHCEACAGKDDYLPETWNFKYDTFFFCGNVSRAVIEPEHSAFTFFGPSACSEDSGLIITAFLDRPLEGEMKNVTTNNVVFQYYNNRGTDFIFESNELIPFSLTIEEYSES